MVCTVLFFCKFSYLGQLHSFTVAILLYHFLPQCSSVTRAQFFTLDLKLNKLRTSDFSQKGVVIYNNNKSNGDYSNSRQGTNCTESGIVGSMHIIWYWCGTLNWSLMSKEPKIRQPALRLWFSEMYMKAQKNYKYTKIL